MAKKKVWNNLADVQIELGVAEHRMGMHDASVVSLQDGLLSYSQACMFSDSSRGDDLPGLLHDWGVALQTVAEHTEGREARLRLLDESLSQLKSSIMFGRCDPAPMNAVGDALAAKAELLEGIEASGMWHRAIEEGYKAAKAINSQNVDALVGLGEAHMALGKGAAAVGDAEVAAEHFCSSVEAYST
eukprot:evm.model.scf_1101.6 EVM.evm.TU.scf_1101.6   scf_1101:27632-29210(-)